MGMGGGGAGVAFYDAYVCVRDKKTQATHGGTFTTGAWRTRDINDEQADSDGVCSIASNQITLAAGTYRCRISCPAFRVSYHKSQLYNITDSAVLLLGTSMFAQSAGQVNNVSFIFGSFTLAAQKTLEVQHQCGSTYADLGLGVGTNYAEEIFTVVEFWREA